MRHDLLNFSRNQMERAKKAFTRCAKRTTIVEPQFSEAAPAGFRVSKNSRGRRLLIRMNQNEDAELR
jgi:hypothetical protein